MNILARVKAMAAVMQEDIEKLNGLIAEAESRLRLTGVDVVATVPMQSGHHLAWKKEGATWGLFVRNQDGTVTPILKTPRGVRIAAANALPQLLEEGLHMMIVTHHEIDRAVVTVRDFVATLPSPEVKELEARPGQMVHVFAEMLCKEAPAFGFFNGTRMEAKMGDTPDALVTEYHRLREEDQRRRGVIA